MKLVANCNFNLWFNFYLIDLNSIPNVWEIILLERQTSVLVSTQHSLYSVSHAECKQQVYCNYLKLITNYI